MESILIIVDSEQRSLEDVDSTKEKKKTNDVINSNSESDMMVLLEFIFLKAKCLLLCLRGFLVFEKKKKGSTDR